MVTGPGRGSQSCEQTVPSWCTVSLSGQPSSQGLELNPQFHPPSSAHLSPSFSGVLARASFPQRRMRTTGFFTVHLLCVLYRRLCLCPVLFPRWGM